MTPIGAVWKRRIQGTKAESERMASAWRHLARSYEFVESLAPVRCPKCNQDMRLLGIEARDNSSELFTFEYTDCGHLEVMGIPVE
jgi:hypothetical protein